MTLTLSDATGGARCLAGILTGRVLGGPRSAALILSRDCNSRCVMCWYHSPLVSRPAGHGPAPAGPLAATCAPAAEVGRDAPLPAAQPEARPLFMASAVWHAIVDELQLMGTKRIVLGGMGETTLHPDLDEMLERLERLGMAPYVISNGLTLDESRVRRWSARRAHFRFSMHGGDEPTWAAVHPTHPPSDFARLSALIRRLATSGRATVSLMNVIQKANVRNIPRMVEYAAELGIRETLFLPVRAHGELAPLVTLGPRETQELRQLLTAGHAKARALGVRTNLLDYLRTARYVRDGIPDAADFYRRMPCYIGWVYTEFDIDGAMRVCENSQVILGHVGERSIRDMWRSDRYAAFRAQGRALPARGGEPVDGCPCRHCTMVKYNLNVHNLLRGKSFRYGEA